MVAEAIAPKRIFTISSWTGPVELAIVSALEPSHHEKLSPASVPSQLSFVPGVGVASLVSSSALLYAPGLVRACVVPSTSIQATCKPKRSPSAVLKSVPEPPLAAGRKH